METRIRGRNSVLGKRILLSLVLLSLVGAPIRAQDSVPAKAITARTANTTLPPEWTYSLRPYFFLSGMSGSVTVEPLTFPVNSSFAYLLENVKVGAFISFTATKENWGVYADFQYINLYGESEGGLGYSLDLKNVIGEVDLVYRPTAAPTLGFLVGIRTYGVGQTVTLVGRELPEATTTVVDPILGGYGTWELHDSWDFELRGDIGGFGVSSESTYQMMAVFRWGLTPTLSVPIGYRVLGYQIQKDDVLMNTRMMGLVVGLDIQF